jgi:RNA polymerase sigma-70 factor (ECF subfamily)
MKTLKPTPDQELLILLREGGESGLDGLFRRHYVDLCRTADRIVLNETAAEDIVQDFFLVLWQKRNTLPIIDSVRAYLHRSVRNRSLNYLRDQKRIPSGDGEMPVLTSSADEASAPLELAEMQKKVDRAINSLPERCRLVYVLSRFEGLSHKEIGEKMDISSKTVENQMGRAYRFLRDFLSVGLLILWLNLSGWS